jgi:two-component system, NtrC family, sensor kinase
MGKCLFHFKLIICNLPILKNVFHRKAIAQLPIVVKLLLPLLSVLLSVWTIGTFGFMKSYLQQEQQRETDDFSVLVSQDLQQKQQLLQTQARWVADKNGLSQAIISENQALLLQTLLPIQAALQLDLIKVVATDDTILADLRQGETSKSTLIDTKIRRAASLGIEQSSIVFADKGPALLVGSISVKSDEKILGGVIVGTAITDNYLKAIRGNAKFEIVALRDSTVIASTLSDAHKQTWQPPQPQSATKLVQIGTQEYFAKTTFLTASGDVKANIVLLTSVTSLKETEYRLWVSIVGFCLLASGIAFLVGIWISRWFRRRIQALTVATQALANGDLTTRIPINSSDEVGVLAQGFNFMAEQLTERDQKISQQMQEIEITLQKLKQTQAQLIHSEKMSSLGQMVAGIAHEINNPASFIRGNLTHAREYSRDILNLLELYQKYYTNPPENILKQIKTVELDFLVEDLDKIFFSMENGCDRITDIVLSLRNFSRLDEAELKCVDIHEGIESTLMIVQNRLKEQAKRPEIKIIKSYGNFNTIECYAGELNQVFLNILNNAIDIFDDGIGYRTTVAYPQIHIQTQLVNQQRVVISVIDNGMGMTQEIASKVFDPFFTTKAVGRGTGLGLSICYQIIVEQHGGKIDCYSQVGKGTEFRIEIPIKQGKTQSLTRVR